MTNGNLDVSQGEAALILHGLLELSAKLDRAQEIASRNGDAAGLRAIDANRAAIGELYGRVRSQHIGSHSSAV